MKKFYEFSDKYLLPFANKLANNRYLSSIKDNHDPSSRQI